MYGSLDERVERAAAAAAASRGGGASRLWRRSHFPPAAAAALRSGLPPPCCAFAGPAAVAAAALAGSVRLGPRAFSHWRKAAAGGLARDWSAAGRPRTWHLIGHAGSGLGVVVMKELAAVGMLAGCSGCGGRGDHPSKASVARRFRGEAGGPKEKERVVAWLMACKRGALLVPEALSQLQMGGVQAPGL